MWQAVRDQHCSHAKGLEIDWTTLVILATNSTRVAQRPEASQNANKEAKRNPTGRVRKHAIKLNVSPTCGAPVQVTLNKATKAAKATMTNVCATISHTSQTSKDFRTHQIDRSIVLSSSYIKQYLLTNQKSLGVTVTLSWQKVPSHTTVEAIGSRAMQTRNTVLLACMVPTIYRNIIIYQSYMHAPESRVSCSSSWSQGSWRVPMGPNCSMFKAPMVRLSSP